MGESLFRLSSFLRPGVRPWRTGHPRRRGCEGRRHRADMPRTVSVLATNQGLRTGPCLGSDRRLQRTISVRAGIAVPNWASHPNTRTTTFPFRSCRNCRPDRGRRGRGTLFEVVV